MTQTDGDTDTELDLSAVAEDLATLSEASTLPDGTVVPGEEPTRFAPEDVDFRSNDWLNRLIDVQLWLALDAPLKASEPVEKNAALLFSQLSSDSVESCYSITTGGVITPTELGLQHLATRLSSAVNNRMNFLENLDSGRSLADASADWNELWEEAGSQTRKPIGSIDAKVETWKIKAFRGYAEEKLLDLNPSYQRGDVWSVGESQMLITSILRGIPLPSVILTQEENGDRYQIVDGKQRLTALLRFMGHHPDGRRFAEEKNEIGLFDRDFRKFAKKFDVKPRDFSHYFLPFKLEKYETTDPLSALSGKYYFEIREKTIKLAGDEVKIKTIFESEASKYLIPVIVYSKTKIEDIHRVFGIYNKQGRKLNAEELRNAIFHHLHLTRLLLLLGGDRDNPGELAPYLPENLAGAVTKLGGMLKDLGVGEARFRRTKVLSWVSAILLHRPNNLPSGQPSTPSTASHINSMLEDLVENQEARRLYHKTALVTFAQDVFSAVDLHSSEKNAWHPKFRNKKGLGASWEDLPLVASVLATLLLNVAKRSDVLTERADAVRSFTSQNLGPKKTQNKTQWEYIARISVGILREFDVDLDKVGVALNTRYGYNCLETLTRLAASTA